jgi:hypothetical protein
VRNVKTEASLRNRVGWSWCPVIVRNRNWRKGQMTLQQEAQQLLEAVESAIPANVNAPQNAREVERLEAEMRRYFRALANALPMEEIEDIYYRYVSE